MILVNMFSRVAINALSECAWHCFFQFKNTDMISSATCPPFP
jgi:hypothetical protein